MENLLLLILLIKKVLQRVSVKGKLSPEEKSQIFSTLFQIAHRQFNQCGCPQQYTITDDIRNPMRSLTNSDAQ